MTAFHPFETAENALENINAITEHEMTEDLRTFLESNLSKGKKASKYPLGVVSDVTSSIRKQRYSYQVSLLINIYSNKC